MNRLRLPPMAGRCVGVTLIAASAYVQSVPTAYAEEYEINKLDVGKLFATSCGWCHQGGGRVAGRGPKLAGTDKPDDFIIKQIKNGRPPGMPAFGKTFSDEQIQAIVAYIRALPTTP